MSVVVESKTFTISDHEELDVELINDGSVSFVIDDRYGGPYGEGTWMSAALTAAQVNELRELLS